MYTCICNAIRECELRKAARQYHSGNAESVYAKLGKKPDCGQCLDDAQDIIEEERAALFEPASAA